MKKNKNNIIKDWLDTYGDPAIEVQVKTEAEALHNHRLRAVNEAMKIYEARGWERFGPMAWHICKFAFYAGVRFQQKEQELGAEGNPEALNTKQ